jgi:hypothetical protein
MKRLILLCVLSALCITSCGKKEAILLDDSYTVTLYPNPVPEGGVFAFHVYGDPDPAFSAAEEISFRLINKNGAVFWETTTTTTITDSITTTGGITDSIGTNSISNVPGFLHSSTVSTYGIPPGIYILECETDHGLLREELVIYPGL